MRAVVFHAHGPAQNLEVADLPVPEPGRGEVLLKVAWSALNHLDIFTREGMPGVTLEFPHIGGSDASGIIEKLGPGVTGWLPGDRVVINAGLSCGECRACRAGEEVACASFRMIGEHTRGSNAEYMTVPVRNLVRVPKDASLKTAAAAGVAYMTAYRMLVSRARVRPGERVLILGAGSGVSTAAIQIARLLGARVYATTSTAAKMERARELGAHHVVNYVEDPDWHKTFYKLTDKEGMDVVIDHVGEATWQKSVRTLAKGGRLVTCGGTTGAMTTQDVRLLFWRQLSLLGSTMANHGEFTELMDLVYRGLVVPPIDAEYDLVDLRDAHRRLEKGEQFGKIMVRVGGQE